MNGHSETKTGIKPRLLVWSAADRQGIARLATSYKDYFETSYIQHYDEETLLENLAYTLAERRTSLSWKSFVTANSITALLDLGQNISKPIRSSSDQNLGFIFTGQGAQWPEMGQELMAFPIFKKSLQDAELFLIL